MKLLFAHSHRFICVNGQYYSNQFPDYLLQRYFNLFDEVIIVARIEYEAKPPVGESLITLPVRVIHIPMNRINKILKWVKESDCVIGRIPSIQGATAIYYAYKLGKPTLSEVVGCGWDAYWNHSLKGKIVAYPLDFINKWAVRHSDFVIYVTAHYLQKCYPSNGITVSCSDVAIAPPSALPQSRIERLNSPRTSLRVGSVGNYDVVYKNQDKIIRAIALLRRQGIIGITCELVGGGDDGRLRNLAIQLGIEDAIVFKGGLAHENMNAWYESLDIYLQVSSLEGLPRSVIEAMSTGCACIVSDLSDMPFMVNDNFFIVSRKHLPEQIADRFKQFMRDASIAKKAANDNLAYAQGYAQEILDKRRLDFYLSFKKTVKI